MMNTNMNNQMMNNNMMNMNNMANPMMNNSNMMNTYMMQNMMMQNMNNQMNMTQMAELMKQMNQNADKTNYDGDAPAPRNLNVVFRVSGQQNEKTQNLIIPCKGDEKVSTLIQRYRDKSGDEDPTKRFIYNAKNLDQSLTVEKAGITNNGNIFVVNTQGMKGAINY